MYPIVFYYCTIILVGTFVYSKPYDQIELNHGNDVINANIKHENEMLFSVGKSELEPNEYEMIKKEPEIFDLSTQVAKFILYFIKKYCKNSEKIGYLQNLITTKGIGSIFKTSPNGNIQADFSHLENSDQQRQKAFAIPNKIEKQGHAINFKFATEPYYQIQAPTIKAETKKHEFIQSVELTTENILISKEFQSNQHHEQQPNHYYIEQEYLPMNQIENDKSGEIKHILEFSIAKPNYKHANVEVMEPMYEYASNGDEYGITEYEYSLPDYDYSVYAPADNTQSTLEHHDIYPIQQINTKLPKQMSAIPEFHDTKVEAQFIPNSLNINAHSKPGLEFQPHFAHETPILEKHFFDNAMNPSRKDADVITEWYKYIMPEQQPNIHETKVNVVPTPKFTNEEPEILDDLFTYIKPEEPEHKIDVTHELPEFNIHHDTPITNYEQPQIKEHIFELPTEDTQQPDSWMNYQEEVQPNIKVNVVTPKIHVVHHKPDFQEPLIRKHIFELATEDTQQPDSWFNYQEMEPKIEHKVETPQIHVATHKPDFQEPFIQKHIFELPTEDTKQPDNWLSFQQEVQPKIKVKVETPQVHAHHEPDFHEPLIQQHTYELPTQNTKQPDNWLKEIEPKTEHKVETPQIHFGNHEPDFHEPLIQEHIFELPTEDTQQPDSWFNYQQEVQPKIEVNVVTPQIHVVQHKPDFQEPLIRKHLFELPTEDTQQPDNWLNYQHEVQPNIEVTVTPQIHFVNHEQPDFQEPLIHKHIFELPTENTKQPDNWLNLQQEVQPNIEVTIGTPQIHFVNHEQPDFQQPLIHKHIFELTTEDTKQPDNWLSYQQEVQPKIETPQIQVVHHEPDFQEPLIHKHIFELPTEHTTQPNSWLNYQQEIKPQIEHKVETPRIQVINHEYPQQPEQPDLQEPSVQQHTFEYSLPNAKQPDNWLSYQQEVQPKIGVTVGTPQIHFVNHEQPDLQEPSVQQHTFDYSLPEVKQPNGWLINQQVNQEPQEHFINHIQPDVKEPLIKHTEYSMPHYGLTAEAAVPHTEEPTSTLIHFKNQEPHTFDISMPGYGSRQFTPKQIEHEFELKHPEVQEHIVEYSNPSEQHPDNLFKLSIPEYEPEMAQPHEINIQIPTGQYISHQYSVQPNRKIQQYSTMEGSQYLLPNVQNKDFHLKIRNEVISPDITLRTYADGLLRNYTIELENLVQMKPYFKETVTGPKYQQFIDNIEKMGDVLSVWEHGGKFYDIPNIEYVKKKMTEISSDTLELINPNTKSSVYEVTTTTTITTQNDEAGLRRTFSGEELGNFLQDPKAKQEFDTLDFILQNVILAYIKLAKAERTPQNKLALLMLLQKIKFIITKYKNLFKQLEWIDGEIDILSKDSDIKMTPEMVEYNNKNLFKGGSIQRMGLNKLNFEDNSNIFLTLFNIPVTAQSKKALRNMIYKLFKDIVDISEIYPEFKNIKYYLGGQKSIETSMLYQRLKEFVASPMDYMKREGLSVTEKILENRRANIEVETTTDTEVETITETEVEDTTIQYTTTQPTTTQTPKKKIEKHHNIFREFLMNEDEKTK